MIYTCIIIDDEPHFTKLMEEYIAEIPQLELVNTYANPREAIAEMGVNKPVDLIFLDINMPHLTGIEIAPYVKEKCKYLIFVTAHAQYAVTAFDLEATDFLYKPFTLERLRQSINKIAVSTRTKFDENDEDDLFYIRSAGTQSKYHKFLYSDIIAFESDKNYIKIYTPDECHRFYRGLNEVEKKLQGRKNFIKVHRSFIISKNHIERVNQNMVVMKKSRVQVSIGKNYKNAFFEYLENHVF